MANEAASVAAEEAPPPATESALPDPPQLSKPDPAQKAIKEPTKPQTPVASMDANKGKFSWGCSLQAVTFFLNNTGTHLLTDTETPGKWSSQRTKPYNISPQNM